MKDAYSPCFYGSTQSLRLLSTWAREHIAKWTTRSPDPEEPWHMKGISTALIEYTGACDPVSRIQYLKT